MTMQLGFNEEVLITKIMRVSQGFVSNFRRSVLERDKMNPSVGGGVGPSALTYLLHGTRYFLKSL
jgi:hypothetical protein